MNLIFFDSVIRATNNVITTIRFFAYQDIEPQTLARMLDYADPLGFVVMEHFPVESEEERIALFRERLQDIEDTFQGFHGLVAGFDENMKRGATTVEPMREFAATGV